MQSHASRHVVSEHLKDLHPDLSEPFPKGVIKNEISEAHGRRAIPKLISVLALPELPDEDRAHALRVFNGLLSTQEHKTNAIHEGAAKPLTRLVNECVDSEVRRLSCEALASLSQIVPGRLAVVQVQGLQALTHALQTTPEAAAGALRQVSQSADGVMLLNKVLGEVVPALVQLISQPKEDGISLKACENATATLAGITTTDIGIVAALESHVPHCLMTLAQRGLSGDFKFEAKLMDMMEQVSICMEQICHHHYGKTAAREAEAYKVLAELIGLQHRATTRHASAALMGMAVEKESKLPVMLYCGLALVHLLRGQDAELAANARAVLCACAEHLEARRTVEMLLSVEERDTLLWTSGKTPLTPPDYRYLVALPKLEAAK